MAAQVERVFCVGLANPFAPADALRAVGLRAAELKHLGCTMSAKRTDAMATKSKLKVVYPLVDEPWGVRRFFMADPNGVIINALGYIKSGSRSHDALQPTSLSSIKAHRKKRTRRAHR